jgi:hypothetical protein
MFCEIVGLIVFEQATNSLNVVKKNLKTYPVDIDNDFRKVLNYY